MKTLITLLAITGCVFAQDLTVTLPQAVSVTERVTTETTTQKTQLKVQYIMVEAVEQYVEIKFVGVNRKRYLRGARYQAFKTAFENRLAAQVGTIIGQQIQEDTAAETDPAPTPTPEPSPTP